MAVPTNIRFPEDVDRELVEFAAAQSLGKSSVVVRAVREWLLLQRHPDITFATGIDGVRRARLVDGPEVWAIAEAWMQHPSESRSAWFVAQAIGLSEGQVESALAYWADQRAEIDSEVLRQHAAQDEALSRWERRRALDRLS